MGITRGLPGAPPRTASAPAATFPRLSARAGQSGRRAIRRTAVRRIGSTAQTAAAPALPPGPAELRRHPQPATPRGPRRLRVRRGPVQVRPRRPPGLHPRLVPENAACGRVSRPLQRQPLVPSRSASSRATADSASRGTLCRLASRAAASMSAAHTAAASRIPASSRAAGTRGLSQSPYARPREQMNAVSRALPILPPDTIADRQCPHRAAPVATQRPSRDRGADPFTRPRRAKCACRSSDRIDPTATMSRGTCTGLRHRCRRSTSPEKPGGMRLSSVLPRHPLRDSSSPETRRSKRSTALPAVMIQPPPELPTWSRSVKSRLSRPSGELSGKGLSPAQTWLTTADRGDKCSDLSARPPGTA
jgi:hypothetical protein